MSSFQDLPKTSAIAAGYCGLRQTPLLVKKGTTFLSHEQFCLKAIQKQHSESQLPGLAVKFTETLIDWCS